MKCSRANCRWENSPHRRDGCKWTCAWMKWSCVRWKRSPTAATKQASQKSEHRWRRLPGLRRSWAGTAGGAPPAVTVTPAAKAAASGGRDLNVGKHDFKIFWPVLLAAALVILLLLAVIFANRAPTRGSLGICVPSRPIRQCVTIGEQVLRVTKVERLGRVVTVNVDCAGERPYDVAVLFGGPPLSPAYTAADAFFGITNGAVGLLAPSAFWICSAQSGDILERM